MQEISDVLLKLTYFSIPISKVAAPFQQAKSREPNTPSKLYFWMYYKMNKWFKIVRKTLILEDNWRLSTNSYFLW